MSEQHLPNMPFKTLGTHLKYLREQSNETLSEVSGAVEIDESALRRIEDGLERPAEDILLLLISHFGMQDQEALQLWELAGYDGTPDGARAMPDESMAAAQKAVVMFLALDTRTLYSDGLDINCGPMGVTLNFTQSTDESRPTISRIGMSYEQAEQVVQSLQHALLRAKYLKGPKRLPPNVATDSPSAE